MVKNLIPEILSEIASYKFKFKTGEFAKSGLIEPRIVSCAIPGNDNDIEEMIMVFEESEKNGYQIVYDSKLKQFGLSAGNSRDGYSLIGIYGSFCDAIDGM